MKTNYMILTHKQSVSIPLEFPNLINIRLGKVTKYVPIFIVEIMVRPKKLHQQRKVPNQMTIKKASDPL